MRHVELTRFGGHLNLSENAPRCIAWQIVRPVENVEPSMMSILELVRTGDKSVSQICRDLDLTESSVRKWSEANQTNSGIMTQNSLSETDQQPTKVRRTETNNVRHREITNEPNICSCSLWPPITASFSSPIIPDHRELPLLSQRYNDLDF